MSDAAAAATVERAWDLGWRMFDTAPLYGYGIAESRTGVVLATKPRAELCLATKVGRLLRPRRGGDRFGRGEDIFADAPPLVPQFDFSADGVLRSLEASLHRLGLDRVDILHIHDPDDHHDAAIAEAFPALRSLREQGVIGAVGAGMNQTEMLCRFAREADFDCFLVAGRYSLLDPSAAAELLPLCGQHGIAVICGGVFNSGLLAGGATYDYAPAPPDLVERTRLFQAVCDRHGVPLKAAAIQFPLGHPAVTCVVVGARSGAEVEENDAMFRFEIPAPFWEDVRRERLLPEDVPTP